MPTLNLGVVDVGYTDSAGATTTGDVAGYLEDRYHIMRSFVELHEEWIGNALANAVAGAIESAAQGKPAAELDLNPVMGSIEERFRDFLDSGEMQRQFDAGQQALPEALTIEAADKGINHRKENPNTQKPRQAFIDTGLYQASFRAWVD
jgi:hypothetical protein